MPLTSNGGLIIHAFSASGALPVPGATVRIKGAEEANRFVVFSLLTDEDGVTERISLPAPEKSNSLSPNPAEIPYSVYDIEVTKPGYYPKRIFNAAVYSGVTSVMPIAMLPLSENEAPEDYPRGNLSSTVEENENL